MRYWPTGNPSNCQVNLLGSQCLAYARYCQWRVYGSFATSASGDYADLTGTISSANCTASTLKSKLYGCAAATHIRMPSPHSISVLSTSNDGITFTDCNSDGYCQVKVITKSWSEFATYIQGKGGITYAYARKGATPPPPDSCTCSTAHAGQYRCTSASTLNIRSGHGTGYGVIGSIPSGATVTISKATGTGENDWGHVSYNGVSGYVNMRYMQRITPTPTSHNPEGILDELTGGTHSIRVRGWTFDRDNLGASLEVHVYVGDRCYPIVANSGRPDVNNVYGVGDYHGFDNVIELDRGQTGTQSVVVYALNVGGGGNAIIGSGTVNITSDTTPPTISNVSISNLTSSGYTISCTAIDANGVDRVQFPTWTTANGQDDLFANWTVNSAASGTKNGNTYTYNVRISDHKNERGEYTTHIYAYDKYGNYSVYNYPSLKVPIDVSSVTLNAQTLSFAKKGEQKTLVATISPQNATNKNLTWATSNSSVATVSNGVVTAVGSGTAIITATSNNGISAKCNVTVAEPVLQSIQIASAPSKTTYYAGDTLNTSGLTLKATYSDGTAKIISSGFTCDKTQLNTAGSQTVTVSYGGKTTAFTVTVQPLPTGTMTVAQASGAPGETVQVAITLISNPGIAAAKLKVAYDTSKLTLIDAADGNLFAEKSFGSDLNVAPYVMTWKNGSANVGTLVTLSFKISDNASAGALPITVSYDTGDIYTKDQANVVMTIAQGTVTVEEAQACPTITLSNVAASGKIKVSWDPVPEADQYEVYRATSKNGTYKLMKTTTGTSYTNTSAVAGTTYYYKVRAIGSAPSLAAAWSDAKYRTCDLPQPVVISSNVASNGKIQLIWEEIDGAVKYEVYRATSKSGTYTLMKTTSKTSYTNTSAEAGKTYYYKVKAIAKNSAANSVYSEVKSRICDLAQPEVSLSNVASSGKIKVSWKAISGAAKYEVYRATSKNGAYQLMKTTTSTSYTNTSAEAGKTYYYKVIALHEKSSANSVFSEAKFRTADLARPVISVSLNNSGKPVVSWNAVSGAVKYTVYMYNSEGYLIKSSTTTNTKLTFISAVAGQIYTYKVEAVHSNINANSAKSAGFSIQSK